MAAAGVVVREIDRGVSSWLEVGVSGIRTARRRRRCPGIRAITRSPAAAKGRPHQVPVVTTVPAVQRRCRRAWRGAARPAAPKAGSPIECVPRKVRGGGDADRRHAGLRGPVAGHEGDPGAEHQRAVRLQVGKLGQRRRDRRLAPARVDHSIEPRTSHRRASSRRRRRAARPAPRRRRGPGATRPRPRCRGNGRAGARARRQGWPTRRPAAAARA